ncbi:hypothetical protein [Agromyces sp. H66]|uniref:hypothetical protein n=1 Tax=Agromyces sp. H66 TaxID=2529859 RepID=UPI00145B491B|nr:hypothetical protein [Agromyces sp. H66]
MTPSPQTSLFTLAALAADIEELTGFPVDVVADSGVSGSAAATRIVQEAVPL